MPAEHRSLERGRPDLAAAADQALADGYLLQADCDESVAQAKAAAVPQ